MATDLKPTRHGHLCRLLQPCRAFAGLVPQKGWVHPEKECGPDRLLVVVLRWKPAAHFGVASKAPTIFRLWARSMLLPCPGHVYRDQACQSIQRDLECRREAYGKVVRRHLIGCLGVCLTTQRTMKLSACHYEKFRKFLKFLAFVVARCQ